MKKPSKKIVIIMVVALLAAMSLTFSACDDSDGEYIAVAATDLVKEDFGIAITKGNTELKNAVNAVIGDWLANGKMATYMTYYSELATGEEVTAPDGLQTEWDFGSATEVIYVYTESGFAPYEFVYNGRVVGLDMAIMSEVAVRVGKKIEIKDVGFDTIATNVAQANGDAVGAAGMSMTDERKEVVDFSDVYSSSTLVVVSLNGQYKSLGELAGKKIGVQEGTSGDLIASDAVSEGGYVYETDDGDVTVKAQGAAVTRYKQYALAYKDLQNGRIDAILMDELPAKYMAEYTAVGGVWERFDKAFVSEQRYKLYFQGLGNTLTIAVFATLIGVVIGVFWAMVNFIFKKTGKLRLLSLIGKAYITVIRGTPVVLQLFIMYFVVLASSDNGILIGALTFGLNSGAYVAEIVRAGFESVDYGQMEAGRSLGMSTGQTMLKIVTPQAVKNVMPPLFNEFITLVKETAVVGYVGIVDLGKVPGLIQSRTFDYLFPLLIAAAMYLVIVLALTGVLKLLEKNMAKADRGYGRRRRIKDKQNMLGRKEEC